jgi:hypothetical protein
MPLAVGARLGPYEIQSALGAGGMGEVYRSRDTRLQRVVAVKVLGAAALVTAAVASLLWQQRGQARLLTDKDTIVLADFSNTTGDSVFDDTLRQGLTIQLAQSPFLSLVSDEAIRNTLTLMGQKPDGQLTPNVAHEICERPGAPPLWMARSPGWKPVRPGPARRELPNGRDSRSRAGASCEDRRRDVSKALDLLRLSLAYDRGPPPSAAPFFIGPLYTTYVRGLVYLNAHRGPEAAAEFQKILDARTIVVSDPVGALAHLQ